MKKQIFMNKFTTTVSKNEVIKMYNEGKLTDKDLLVCEFLFNNRFATLYQINAMLRANGHTDLQSQRAFKLSQNRIINRFLLSEEEDVQFNDDSKMIYCLDIGGKYLLTHYSSLDTTEWLTSNNMMSQDIVENVLMANDVYIKLLTTIKDKLVSFRILEERRVGKQSTTIDFDFGIKLNEDTVKYYICNFFRESDMSKNFQNKAVKLESLITTNGWKKYYFGGENAPACFFVGESDSSALNIATQINECYSFAGKDRYSTFSRLIEKNLYDRDIFLKYEYNGIEKSFKSSRIASFIPDDKK